MEKETTGTVISVTKQWWLKVNRKPVRTHAMDGAAFPHIIKVKYTIGVKDYTCQKWIGAGNKIPDKGTTIKAGVSLLAFEVYASYIKSVARSFYSQLLLLWIPMRTKFPLCFLSAFFLILFLFPFIQILSTFLV